MDNNESIVLHCAKQTYQLLAAKCVLPPSSLACHPSCCQVARRDDFITSLYLWLIKRILPVKISRIMLVV